MLFGSEVSRLCPSSTCPPVTGVGGESEGPWFSAPAAPLSVQLPMPAPIILCDKLLFLCRPAFGDRRMGLSSGQTDFLPWAGSSAAP